MARVSYPESGDIRWEPALSTLKELCRNGVTIYWIRDIGRSLLELEVVKQAVKDDAGFNALPEGLINVLRDLVQTFRYDPDGVLLWIVLGLEDPYEDRLGVTHPLLKMNAHDRRTLAGEEFRGGEKQVGPGAIRTLHEPKALRRLTALLLQKEIELTGKVLQKAALPQALVERTREVVEEANQPPIAEDRHLDKA
ncbi:MAG TPA: hypothetical protein VG944_00605 [Fimbriimonas sp.]|nr:hypothetical protein [Fimbriimonas sp.]